MPGDRLGLLTAAEPGRRNRRTIDALLVAAGAGLAAAAAVCASSAPDEDEDVAQAVVTVLGWAPALWRAALVGALAVAFVIAADALLRRRWAIVRDLLVVLLVVVGVGSALWSRWGFAELSIACVAAVVAVAGPELVRPVRVLAIWLVSLAALGSVALESALPSGALGALALGLGTGALVRLAFGTAAGMPSAEHVRLALAALGVKARDINASAHQRIGAGCPEGELSPAGALQRPRTPPGVAPGSVARAMTGEPRSAIILRPAHLLSPRVTSRPTVGDGERPRGSPRHGAFRRRCRKGSV